MTKIRIMVVEDEGITAQNIRQRLEHLGYEVPVTLTSGEAAIEQAAKSPPDLVLMDIGLTGEMDGITAASEFRRRFNIPIIYLTAHADEYTIQRAKITEPFGYLLKPFQIRELRSTIEMAIYKHKAEQEIYHRNRELTLLNRIIIASAAAPNGEPSALLQTVCVELAQAFSLPHVSATLMNEFEAVIAAEYRLDPQPADLGMTIPLSHNPFIRVLTDRHGPLVINNVQQNAYLADFQARLKQGEIVTMVFLPLEIEQKIVGCLNLYLDETCRLSAEEVNLAWSVAGEVSGVLTRNRLAAEHQHLEEQYRQAQKMEAIGRLAAGIAHDFNNLLTSINGFAELLQQQFELNNLQENYVNNILRSGRRAAGLVQQLLAFSHKHAVKLQTLSINEVVAGITEMLQRIIGESIDLKINLTPNLWPVQADPGQLEQVIVNLAVNARDAMPDGGCLTIETANIRLSEADVAGRLETPPGDYVLLAVSDTGSGIATDLRGHIFEPFFTTKTPGQGTGLGLAMVYGIVKQSQGDIRVESPAPNHSGEGAGPGTMFKIYLPRVAHAVSRPSLAHDLKEMPTGQETVLMVEDDPSVRELMRQVLQRQGYYLLEAQEAGEAWRLAEQHPGPIHLLLTDVIMPGINGKDLADRLAQVRPDLKILFMSGYTDEMIDRHGVLTPGIAFIPKPFSPMVLAQTVRAVLDNLWS